MISYDAKHGGRLKQRYIRGVGTSENELVKSCCASAVLVVKVLGAKRQRQKDTLTLEPQWALNQYASVRENSCVQEHIRLGVLFTLPP